MGLLTYIILLAITGLIVGALARLALPGKDPMSIPKTVLIGIAGSFLAGLIVYAINGGEPSGMGIVLSVAVSTGLVYLGRRRRGGSLTDPGLGARR